MNQPVKYHRRVTIPLVATLAAFGVGWKLVMLWGFPACYLKGYPLIPVYFIVLALSISAGIHRYIQRNPAKHLIAYLFSRLFKILFTLGFSLLYIQLIEDDLVVAISTIALFYFVYLCVETLLFYRYEVKNRQP